MQQLLATMQGKGTSPPLLAKTLEEISSGTLENSTRPLPSWKREIMEHIDTLPLQKGEANYIPQKYHRGDRQLATSR